MKKIITILTLLICSVTYSQEKFDTPVYETENSVLYVDKSPTINLHLENSKNILDNSKDVRPGPIMLLGGASFIAAGLLTPPIMVGGSTTEKKPFFQQGGRAAAIISGGVVMFVGFGFTISGN